MPKTIARPHSDLSSIPGAVGLTLCATATGRSRESLATFDDGASLSARSADARECIPAWLTKGSRRRFLDAQRFFRAVECGDKAAASTRQRMLAHCKPAAIMNEQTQAWQRDRHIELEASSVVDTLGCERPRN